MIYEQRVLMTVQISAELHRAIKAAAALQGKKMREVVIEALEQWLKDNYKKEGNK